MFKENPRQNTAAVCSEIERPTPMYGTSRYTMLRNLDFFSPRPSPFLFHRLSPSAQFRNISLTPILWCIHGGDVAHPGAPDLCSIAQSVNGTRPHFKAPPFSALWQGPSLIPPTPLRPETPTTSAIYLHPLPYNQDLVSATVCCEYASLFLQIDPSCGIWTGFKFRVETDLTATTTTFRGGLVTSSV